MYLSICLKKSYLQEKVSALFLYVYNFSRENWKFEGIL